MSSARRGKLVVILNQESGTLLKLGPEQVEVELRRIFEELGCGVEIRWVPG